MASALARGAAQLDKGAGAPQAPEKQKIGELGEPKRPEAGVQSDVGMVQPQGGERTIKVTRDFFPEHPPRKSTKFAGQEDYEEYLKHFIGGEPLVVTEADERRAKEAGYSCFLDYYREMVHEYG